MKGGTLGFVITSKIMQALYAANARKHLVTDNTIQFIKDFSSSGIELFKEATNYPMLLVATKELPVANKHILIQVVTPKDKLIEWRVLQRGLPLIPSDPMSPWLIAPPDVIRSIRKMQECQRLGDSYDVMSGVKTGNDLTYIVTDIKETTSRNLVTVTTKQDPKTKKKQSFNIEPELVYPFITGEDIRPWEYQISKYILWTHDPKGRVREKLPPTEEYFNSRKNTLTKRQDYKFLIRKKATQPPVWIIFRVNEEKMKNKVAWRKLAPYMQCTPIPSDTEIVLSGSPAIRKIILKNKVYFIVEESKERSLCLAGFMNSTPVRVYLQSFSAKFRGGWFSYYSWAVGLVPVPLDNMLNISIPKIGIPEQEHLDKEIGKLYGLSDDDLDAIRSFHLEITSHNQEIESNDEEIE
jgi:hypothetical protein